MRTLDAKSDTNSGGYGIELLEEREVELLRVVLFRPWCSVFDSLMIIPLEWMANQPMGVEFILLNRVILSQYPRGQAPEGMYFNMYYYWLNFIGVAKGQGEVCLRFHG